MKHEQQQITDFMVKAQQDTPQAPTMPDFNVRLLRYKLIHEELHELAHAFGFTIVQNANETSVLETHAPNLVEAYDAVLDLLVVVIGTGVAMGVELEPGWEEVHRSNMSKFIDGHRREDGKWIKGPSYTPAQLQPIIQQQIEDATPDAPPIPA